MKYFLFLVFFISASLFSSAQNQSKTKASLNHTAIFVMDLKRSGDFYQQIIGLDTIAEPFHDGKHIWLRTGEHTMLHIIQGADAKKEYYKNQHTCFSVRDITVFAETLKKSNCLKRRRFFLRM